MHIMQYEINLPTDYDMSIIRRRVATGSSGTDTFGGLGLKAYCIREAGVDGSTINQYAPFYFWVTSAGMNDFLCGCGFARLSTDFGRPSVRHWTSLAFEHGPARETTPLAASRSVVPVPIDARLDHVIGAALDDLQARCALATVHCTALALDPTAWELAHFTLWADSAPETAGTRYQVLHLSRPHLQDLRAGRQW